MKKISNPAPARPAKKKPSERARESVIGRAWQQCIRLRMPRNHRPRRRPLTSRRTCRARHTFHKPLSIGHREKARAGAPGSWPPNATGSWSAHRMFPCKRSRTGWSRQAKDFSRPDRNRVRQWRSASERAFRVGDSALSRMTDMALRQSSSVSKAFG